MGMMKYLRYEGKGVVLFETNINHAEMHKLIQNPNDKLMSAGTVALWVVNNELEVQAGNGSITLNISSLDDDAELIKRRLKLY